MSGRGNNTIFKDLLVMAKDERGQTIVEYCIMVGIVGPAIIAATPSVTSATASFFAHISTQLGQCPNLFRA